MFGRRRPTSTGTRHLPGQPVRRAGETAFAGCWRSSYVKHDYMRRKPATRELIEGSLIELGRRYHGAGRLFLVGGSQMIYLGFRRQTEDIDYVVDLEGDNGEFVAAVRSIIRELDVSAEPARPGDFIPLPQGRQDQSPFAGRYGRIDVFTFDPISTALAKIERGAGRDIDDALSLIQRGLVSMPDLLKAFEEILPRLETESLRVDEEDFRRKVEAFVTLVQRDQISQSEDP